jgi:hypothetical protein
VDFYNKIKMLKATKVMSNKCVQVLFLPAHFNFISSQMHANSNPGQFWMSYSNGFDGSLPKFASIVDTFGHIVTAGKRRSTVGLIGTFRPAN